MATADTLATLSGQRQVSIRIPLADWQILERSAAAKRKPVTHLLMELLEPGLRKLRANPPARDDDDA